MGWLYQYIVRAIPIFFLQQFYYRILCLLEFSLQLERNSILSPLVPKCMYIFLNQSSATWSVILINFVDFQSRKNSINLCRNVLEDGQIVKLLNLLECSFWDTKILYANIDPCTGIGTVGVFLSGWASYILVGGIFGSKGRGKWFPTRNFTPSIWYFFWIFYVHIILWASISCVTYEFMYVQNWAQNAHFGGMAQKCLMVAFENL